MTPPASPSAVSTESVTRLRMSGLATRRSTTTADVVLVGLLEDRRLGELDELAVDDRAGVALGAELLEEVDELALLLR